MVNAKGCNSRGKVGGLTRRSKRKELAFHAIESLEVRQFLTTVFNVTDTTDNPTDTGSIRYAFNHLSPGNAANTNEITFSSTVSGHTILLTSGVLTANYGVTIDNTNPNTVTISGGGTSSILDFHAIHLNASVTGLTLIDGVSPAVGVGSAITASGNLTLVESTVSGNTGADAAIFNNYAAMTVQDCLISGNSASYVAAIDSAGGSLTISNSTLAGNNATDPGGTVGAGAVAVYAPGQNATLNVSDSTFSGNTTTNPSNAYDIYLGHAGTGFTASGTMVNSILASASLTSPHERNVVVVTGGSFTSDGNNISTDSSFTAATGDKLHTDPQLQALADNGGPTKTQALATGSPAIDAGSNSAASGVAYDQRGPGYARIFNGTVDIGAYEYGSTFVSMSDHLQFMQQPTSAAAGDKINPPITVAVESPSNAVDASDHSTVTLAIASGNGRLLGTASAPAVNGVATFSNVSIDQSGTFTVTATDSNTAVGTTTSNPFSVVGGKLVFLTQPRSGSTGAPLAPFKVAIENSKGKILTTDTSTPISLMPLAVAGTSGVLSGDTTETVYKGVATFSAVQFSAAGSLQLVAQDGADPIATSHAITLKGLHLVFRRVPKTADASDGANAGLAFNPAVLVAVENSRNQVINSGDSIAISLVNVANANNVIQATANAQTGVATFADVPGSAPVGTYTLTAQDGTSAAASHATATLKVLGLHLVIKRIPRAINAGSSGLAFNPPIAVLLENSKNRIINSGDSINLALANVANSSFAFGASASAQAGVVDFSNIAGDFSAGTYSVTVIDETSMAAADLNSEPDPVAHATGSLKVK